MEDYFNLDEHGVNFVYKHIFEGVEDAAHFYYKQRQTSLRKALTFNRNLPYPSDFPQILNSKPLLSDFSFQPTLIDLIPKDFHCRGLKPVTVPPLVLQKSDLYNQEREKALRILRGKLITQIMEKSRLIKEKATRKNQGKREGAAKTARVMKMRGNLIDRDVSEENAQVREIANELQNSGQRGLQESDVMILKNVLEVLPQECFRVQMKDTCEMDEKEINSMLLSYQSRREVKSQGTLVRNSKSTVNLRKETNLTKYNAVKQSDVLKRFFELNASKSIMLILIFTI